MTGAELSATPRKPDTWPAGTWAERAIWASERAVEPDGIWKADWEGFEGRTDDCCGSNAPLARKLVDTEEWVYGLHGGSVLTEGVNGVNGWVPRPSDAEGEEWKVAEFLIAVDWLDIKCNCSNSSNKCDSQKELVMEPVFRFHNHNIK